MEGRPPLLYNTMSGKKEKLRTLEENKVKIFTCGPSIYRRPHIGNHRTFLFEDIMVRYLEYLGYEVERAMNITDVEDKAIERAEHEHEWIFDMTERNERILKEEMDLLGFREPTHMPRASESADQSAKIVKALMEKGLAYKHGSDIYYDPTRFKGFGRLYGLDMSKWPEKKRRFHKDTYPGHRWNRGDFILWRGCGEEDRVCFEDGLGSGRPAWNVQDGAMVVETLGDQIDIWCGGIDNLIRHHDYNIAVVEGYTGKELAPFWMHGGHLTLEGKKMSKSKGNVLYAEDLLKKGYQPHHVRFFLIYGDYRKNKNINDKIMAEEGKILDDLRGIVAYLMKMEPGNSGRIDEIIDRLEPEFRNRMSDDLDVKGAFDDLREDLRSVRKIVSTEGISGSQKERLRRIIGDIDSVLMVIVQTDAPHLTIV